MVSYRKAEGALGAALVAVLAALTLFALLAKLRRRLAWSRWDILLLLPLGLAAAYFRALSEGVRPGGVVLIHTHQATDHAGMLDPSGPYIQAARRAGLGYLQHHVIVHTRLLAEPLSARDGAERNPPRHARIRPRHRRVHSDLLAFHA